MRYKFAGRVLAGLIVISFACASGTGTGAYAAKSGSSGSKNRSSPSDSGHGTGLGHLIEPNEVAHIEMEKDHPGAMIGSRIYYINDEAFGGKVVEIADNNVTIKFKDHTKSYRVGDMIDEKEGKQADETIQTDNPGARHDDGGASGVLR